jgi:hypothetical protein
MRKKHHHGLKKSTKCTRDYIKNKGIIKYDIRIIGKTSGLIKIKTSGIIKNKDNRAHEKKTSGIIHK